jgi:uncharacterized protein
MDALTPWQLAFCAMVVTVAFAVRGGAGFGGGAVATPLLALVLPVRVVLPVVAAMLVIASFQHVHRERRNVQWREVRRIAPWMILGVCGGLYLLVVLDPKPLGKALGVFVTCYAIYALTATGRGVAVAPRWVNALAAVLSLAAGFAGALFGGAAGPLYVVYLRALHMERDRFRATMTMLMMAQGLTRIVGYIGLGLYNSAVFVVLATALPLMWFGNWLGDRVVRRFDQRRFERGVAWVMLSSGVVLILK